MRRPLLPGRRRFSSTKVLSRFGPGLYSTRIQTSQNAVNAKFVTVHAHRRRQEKSRAALGRGKVQRAPGLTIGRIVVPGRGGEYIPHGISLYAMWLLLEPIFGEQPFRALRSIRARERAGSLRTQPL